jgi:hypothetical protein
MLRADTVNFNDVGNGTVVGTRYAGVTFANPLGGDIYARNLFNPSNATNGVSVFSTAASPTGDFNAQFGAVDATFDVAQGFVSIDLSGILNSGDLLGNSPLHPFMEVYSGTTLLSKIFYANPLGSGEVGAYETLTYLSAVDNITRIRLSSQYDSTGSSGPNPFAEFDNLVFANRSSGSFPSTGVINPLRDQGPTSVPEPASLSLVGIGLVALRKAVKRSKR